MVLVDGGLVNDFAVAFLPTGGLARFTRLRMVTHTDPSFVGTS